MTEVPEMFGRFVFWPPDNPDQGWSISDAGGWLPGILADREACITLTELYPARVGIEQLDQLRKRYNCARPSILITSKHLAELASGQSAQGEEVSQHYKFEVHVKTRGELDTEEGDVKDMADLVTELARKYGEGLDMEIKVTEVERT